MNILVLGGGQQGRIIAGDLARGHRVTVADVRKLSIRGVRTMQLDVSRGMDALIAKFDLAVCALPSRFGLTVARAALAARRSLVDITFFADDPLVLDGAARKAGIAIMPDCGLSPGLSNLVIGRIGGKPRHVEIRVGGIAANRKQDYVITWSVDDLIEEFVRPARIVRGGRRVTVEACSGVERVKVPGAGELEAFYTDGLRTLLDTCPARDMAEKTMRWPGHIARMVALREMGMFEPERRALAADVLRACYTADPPKDLVVLDVQVDRWRATMVSRRHGGLTAMARTTALTCAVTARLVADGWKGTGVLPLERVGSDAKAYEYMRKELARRGVRWTGV